MAADQLTGEEPSGPAIKTDAVFEEFSVPTGSTLVNEIGSVHQSYTGPEGCVLLLLWSACHARTLPENVNSEDCRLHKV